MRDLHFRNLVSASVALALCIATAAHSSSYLSVSEMSTIRGGCKQADCIEDRKCNSGSVDCKDPDNQLLSCYRCASSITSPEPKHEKCDHVPDGEHPKCTTSVFLTGCGYKTYGLCQYQSCNTAGQERSDNGCGLTFYGPEARRGCDTD
jgi:hypothetical protein